MGVLKVSMTLNITSPRSWRDYLHCIIICVLVLYLTILSVVRIMTSRDKIKIHSIWWVKATEVLRLAGFSAEIWN